MKNFLRRLFCPHDFTHQYSEPTDNPKVRKFIRKCLKCGKVWEYYKEVR